MTPQLDIALSERQLEHVGQLERKHRLLFEDPQNAEPIIIVCTPVGQRYTVRERTADPEKMLESQLDAVRSHLLVGDDCIPSVRVELGTGLIASAYGCEIYEREDAMPSVKGPILSSAEEAADLPHPARDAGWMKRLAEYTAYFRQAAPDFVRMQLPDIHGVLDNAYMLRGSGLFLDFFDEPEAVAHFFDRLTGYIVESAREISRISGSKDGFFCDCGVLWKGCAEIAGCCMHMISTEFYQEFVREYDQRFMDEVGGGRIHYCGSHDSGIFDSLFALNNMYGIDYPGSHHDLWDLSRRAPDHVTLLQYMEKEQIDRLLTGDWPDKRNLVLYVSANSTEEGRDLYLRLKKSIPARGQKPAHI